MIGFEEYFSKQLCGNLKCFIEKNIENITAQHVGLAEILGEV